MSILKQLLLSKCSWRFALERKALWNQVVVVGKFGEEKRRSYTVKNSYEVGLKKAIKRGWDANKCRTSFIVRNERRVKFWKDKWCGGIISK